MSSIAGTITETGDTMQGSAGLDALLSCAGWAPLRHTGWIAVTGSDRVRWLNGMVTNSVQALTPGEGAYSFLLSAQGRIQGEGTVWCEAERLLIETSRDQVEPMTALLDRFIIMDEVELADESERWHGLQIAGPDAVEALAAAGVPARAGRLLRRNAIDWRGANLYVITAYSPLVPRFEIWSEDTGAIEQMRSALAATLPECSEDDFEELRIAEGTPAYGVDIRDRDLPQETAQSRALHFNKGCYLGQEIVERIRSRGQVHRTFASFTLHGEAPTAGTELLADDKPAGLLTSVSKREREGKLVALGFVRREVVERGGTLKYAGGTAEAYLPRSASNPETGKVETEPHG